jgi:hypothetical protein
MLNRETHVPDRGVRALDKTRMPLAKAADDARMSLDGQRGCPPALLETPSRAGRRLAGELDA